MLHPRRGFIKLEDTVAITATGTEGFGDQVAAGTALERQPHAPIDIKRPIRGLARGRDR
jgi:hypothetical protein